MNWVCIHFEADDLIFISLASERIPGNYEEISVSRAELESLFSVLGISNRASRTDGEFEYIDQTPTHAGSMVVHSVNGMCKIQGYPLTGFFETIRSVRLLGLSFNFRGSHLGQISFKGVSGECGYELTCPEIDKGKLIGFLAEKGIESQSYKNMGDWISHYARHSLFSLPTREV